MKFAGIVFMLAVRNILASLGSETNCLSGSDLDFLTNQLMCWMCSYASRRSCSKVRRRYCSSATGSELWVDLFSLHFLFSTDISVNFPERIFILVNAVLLWTCTSGNTRCETRCICVAIYIKFCANFFSHLTIKVQLWLLAKYVTLHLEGLKFNSSFPNIIVHHK